MDHIGIDLHKPSSQVCILTADGELVERRIKTDKRDARALCEACRLGAYRPAHRTSDRQRVVRAHLTVREALIRTRSKYIVLIGALARREGCRIKAGPPPTSGGPRPSKTFRGTSTSSSNRSSSIAWADG